MSTHKRAHALAAAALCLLWCGTASAQGQADTRLTGKHVLVIPLSAPPHGRAKLDKELDAAINAAGATAVSAKVRKSDITAITGCAGESPDCYDQIAQTLGVDHIVFGKVAETSSGEVVSLTLVGGGSAPRTAEIRLETGATRNAAFRAATKRFLVGTPELTSAPVAAPTAPGAKPAQPTTGYSLSRVKGSSWLILGSGLAAAGTGTLLLVLARGKQSDVDAAPTETAADLDRLADLEGSGKALTAWGNVFLIGGSIAAVTGAVLATRQARHTREAPPVAVGASPVSGGFGLTVSGRF